MDGACRLQSSCCVAGSGWAQHGMAGKRGQGDSRLAYSPLMPTWTLTGKVKPEYLHVILLFTDTTGFFLCFLLQLEISAVY